MSLSVFSYCICIFSVTVAVSTHLCVVCHHFCCPMSLFQGNVASENLPTGHHLDMEKALSAFDEKNCLTLLWNCLVSFCETKESENLTIHQE